VRAVEKGSIGADLSPCKAEAEQKKSTIEKRGSFPVCIFHHAGSVDDRQHRGLNDEQCKEKAKVTPKKARNLRLDSGARDLKGGTSGPEIPPPVLANVKNTSKSV